MDPQPFGELSGMGNCIAHYEDCKLLAAQAHGNIAAPAGTQDFRRHPAQYHIALIMAVGVVHTLEMVDIQHQHRDPVAGAAVLNIAKPLDDLLHIDAREQSRQGIANRAFVNPLPLHIELAIDDFPFHRNLQWHTHLLNDLTQFVIGGCRFGQMNDCYRLRRSLGRREQRQHQSGHVIIAAGEHELGDTSDIQCAPLLVIQIENTGDGSGRFGFYTSIAGLRRKMQHLPFIDASVKFQ